MGSEEVMSRPEVLRQKLLEKLADLPEARLQEVLDFIDFLRSRERTGEDPILQVAGCLSGSPLSAEEIEGELYGEDPA
jgi:hypothetical protein